MKLRNNIGLLLVALSFPFTYTNAEFRGGGSSSRNTKDKSFIVAIYKDEEYVCVGSLITLEYVVTALECLKENEETVTVKAGLYSKSQTEEVQVSLGGTFIREEDTLRKEVYIGIIGVSPPFKENSAVRTIELCSAVLEKGVKMQIGSCYSRLSNQIPSTKVTLPEKSSCTSARSTTRMFGYALTSEVDSGAPGVVGGTLCAVATSYFGSTLYVDLSEGGRSFYFVKEVREFPS